MNQAASNQVTATMNYIQSRLADVNRYGLQVEVIYWALKAMKENSENSIESAFEAGCDEWDIGFEPEPNEPDHTLGVELT